ncbi:MAG: hypothetical protein LUE10_06955, partial [Alistipes sp.]|nr:hypothetical protein [Alistipes sp.]
MATEKNTPAVPQPQITAADDTLNVTAHQTGAGDDARKTTLAEAVALAPAAKAEADSAPVARGEENAPADGGVDVAADGETEQPTGEVAGPDGQKGLTVVEVEEGQEPSGGKRAEEVPAEAGQTESAEAGTDGEEALPGAGQPASGNEIGESVAEEAASPVAEEGQATLQAEDESAEAGTEGEEGTPKAELAVSGTEISAEEADSTVVIGPAADTKALVEE